MGTPETVVSELTPNFAGRIITAVDEDYDQARAIFNAMIDRHPAVIAQCASVKDVVAAIQAARNAGMEISVRGGGHGVAGAALVDDGLVIDLRLLNSATVDAKMSTVTVGGGATMSDLDQAGKPFGLATTGGRVSSTGVGGLVFGGGGGWLDRAFGLACDNLVSADLVTASGERVHASNEENTELFWALHGGGGNFGVVTSLTMRLHPLPSATLAMLFWDPAEGPAVGRAFRDFMMTAPNAIGGGLMFLTGPDEEFVPEHLRGQLAIVVVMVFTGPEAGARIAMAPMMGHGHLAEMIAEMPYADLNSSFDDPAGMRNYYSAEYLFDLPDEAIDRVCARAGDMVVPSSSAIAMARQGGAVGDGPSGYPVPWRAASWIIHPLGIWDDPADDERMITFTHNLCGDVAEWATGSVYLNFIGDEGRARTIAGFGADNYERLVAVKDQYDPDNVFHHNHNIEPSLAR